MRKLKIGKEYFEAEKIVKRNEEIFGITKGINVFSLKGIKDFSLFILEDGKDFDVLEPSLEERIEHLENVILDVVFGGVQDE